MKARIDYIFWSVGICSPQIRQPLCIPFEQMDPNTVTLILGLAGLTATLIASAIGFYFNSKARGDVLRAELFQRQADIVVELIGLHGRFKVFATILSDDGGPFHEDARRDLGKCLKDFSIAVDRAAAVLPVELWTTAGSVGSKMTDVGIEYDENGTISDQLWSEALAEGTKLALLSRTVLGVEEQTEENLKISSTRESYERLAQMEGHLFLSRKVRDA